MRSIHPLSWLAKAADLELAAGRLRLLRAAARRLLVVDHSLLGKHAVVSGLGLDMGHGRWSRWFVVVGYSRLIEELRAFKPRPGT